MSPTAFCRLLSGVRSSPGSASAGPRTNGMALSGSNNDQDDSDVDDLGRLSPARVPDLSWR
eukprot:13834897-Heterocapsa_arctica.AAC.1